MWKVETGDVFRYLFVTDIFLSDVFEWLKENKTKDMTEIQENLMEDTSLLGDLANNLETLFHVLLDLVSHEKIDEVITAYEAMEKDYFTFLTAGANTIKLSDDANELVEKAFSYFYKDLLTRQAFWNSYNNGNKNFSTSKFREEMGRLRPVCPYCDAAKVHYYKHSNSDHFLAYSHFPFLSIHWGNLVVSCLGCNLYVKNDKFIGTKDGVSNFIPIFHPYFHEAASYIKFNFDKNLNITIDRTIDTRVLNYLDLFELENAYKGAYHDVKSLWEEIEKNILDKYVNYQNIGTETAIDKLKRIYIDTIKQQKNKAEGSKGVVMYTKLFLDLCDFKLCEDEMSKQLLFLQKTLGITSATSVSVPK